jgi:acetyl esterase/lipase
VRELAVGTDAAVVFVSMTAPSEARYLVAVGQAYATATEDTGSYRRFADGSHLTAKAVAWLCDAYLPENDKRTKITASPPRATFEELTRLPETLLIVDENDGLRCLDADKAWMTLIWSGGKDTAKPASEHSQLLTTKAKREGDVGRHA